MKAAESSSSVKVEESSSSEKNEVSSSSEKPVESSSSEKVVESSSSEKSSSSAGIPSKLYDCEIYKCVTTKYLNPDIEYGEYLDVRDSQVYRTVQIGEQVWMAQNLNYKNDNQSFCFDSNTLYCKEKGRLYTWENALKVCPEGWHLPDSTEFGILLAAVKDPDNLKSTVGWSEYNAGDYFYNGNGSDDYGFSAIPVPCEAYDDEGEEACLCTSSSPKYASSAYYLNVRNQFSPSINTMARRDLCSVRCIKD
jgi:uncharacterized protein (TIGR02145 family)